MKFDSIKEKAKHCYAGALDHWDRNVGQSVIGQGALVKGSYPAFEALLPFILATQDEREEMRVFAHAFKGKPGDWLANAAQSENDTRLDVAWNQVVLRAREAGLELIDNWDVRQVGKLIELFPESVPAKYRGKPLTCYMADNEDCDWMVEPSSLLQSHEAAHPLIRG